MKTASMITLITIILIINQSLIGQTAQISGTINSDTLWNSDTISVIGNVTIPNGLRLTIASGVTVQFQDYYKIVVNGSLYAIGSETDSIRFTVVDTSGFYSNHNSIDGSWDGIHIIGEDNYLDTTVFNYCRLEFGKNFDTLSGDVNGGVLYAYNYDRLEISNCLFLNNTSIGYVTSGSRGGAIFCEEIESISINNNRFLYNMSNNCGGAISIDKLCKSVVISNNYFLWNTSNLGSAIHSSDLTYGHTIANNYCFNNYNASNGVIYTSNPYGWIYNNVICNNDGPGIVDGHQLSVTKIFGNTVVNNYTSIGSGGILIHSRAKVYNNVCWGNITKFGQIPVQIYQSNLSNPYLEYNCVQYGEGGLNAISEYPEFVNPSDGPGAQYNGENANWSLINESPCINTGTEDTAQLNIPLNDITGSIRIFGNRIDIGAYENQEIWVFSDEFALLEEDVSVFPNPATTNLTIEVNTPNNKGNYTFSISDALGKVFFQTKISDQEQSSQINVSDWASGLYLVVVSSPEGVAKRTKVIVK